MTALLYPTYHIIDDALKQYYAQLGYLDYYYSNGNGTNGLFLNYIIEQKLDQELAIEDELNNTYDPSNYSYSWLHFDITFPIPYYATTLTHNQQQTFKFYIVRYCYKFNKAPSDEYIAKVLLPKCNVSAVAAVVTEESAQGTCVDEIVDDVLKAYISTYSCDYYNISDMEISLNLFVINWNNNGNKRRKLTSEQLKVFLVTIHTNVRLDFIQLSKNFNIPACAAMQLWMIVNDILNDNSMTYALSDESWPPSLCSGFNQDDVSDDDDTYDEVDDNTQDTQYQDTICDFSSFFTSNRIIPQVQVHHDKWDVNLSTADDLYYNRCILPLKMQQLCIQMNNNQLTLAIIIIKQAFK